VVEFSKLIAFSRRVRVRYPAYAVQETKLVGRINHLASDAPGRNPATALRSAPSPELRASGPQAAAVPLACPPVFVANSDSDHLILTRCSYLLAGLLPDARLKIYPDAAHGFFLQHAAEFAAIVDAFLNE
jgi:pimeloyl-ACP methyl ester carboxylesterase